MMLDKNHNQYYRSPILDGLEFLHAKNHKISFPFHSHPTFNITLILDHPFATKLADRLMHAPKGSLFISNPDEVHATLCETQLGNSFYTFYVAPDVLKKLNNHKSVFFNDRTIYDADLFEALYFVAQNFGNSDFLLEQKLMPLLKRLVFHHSTAMPHLDSETQLFRKFIEEETFEKFSLDQTALKFGLDKYKFLRLFKNETGLTPNNFIIQQRIEKSKKLLQSQNDILDIALETGFYDATHFCKHFKKVTGISPGMFRNA
ncbi:AraC family transcriptional regulator [Flavobacterium sp.]|uniref:helix-turn-helix domain-containing protein n=1 Tax=Flavobacterium sp. TaxID=239 RepID=UPI00286B1055|nr:AraC family transcriptional regulator [Flavobacterium sp.]